MGQVNRFTFSNLVGVTDAHYCSGHGRTPGVLTVSVKVYPFSLNIYGDAAFTDGTTNYVIPDCRVNSIRTNHTPTSRSWMIEVSDHRWRWETPLIDGEYNVQDRRQNLVPGTIKTPKELARILCDRMGEKDAEIDMPEGVKEGGGPRNEFPAPGEGIKSVTPDLNPPVSWRGTNASEALQCLAESFDRAIVWCNYDRKVKVVKRSVGQALPEGSVEAGGESLMLPPLRSGYGIIGADIRFQMRFPLDDYGHEWHGGLVRLKDLSYAPTLKPVPGEYQLVLAGAYDGATNYTVTVDGRTVAVAGAGDDTATLQALANAINADPVLKDQVSASVAAGPQLIVTGKRDGQSVDVSGGGLNARTSREPVDSPFDFSCPPRFPNVNRRDSSGPDRLTYNQALSRAQGSVFRIKRIQLADPGTGPKDKPKPLRVPKFDQDIVYYHQIDLLPSKIEQVTPQPRDPDRIRGTTGDIVAEVPDYYDGWSRDQSAAVYGSVYVLLSSPVHRIYRSDKVGTQRYNTDFKDRVEVPFSVDPDNWAVTFSSPVYEMLKTSPTDGRSVRPRLILETSCYLRDAKTHARVQYRRWVKLGVLEKDDKETTKRDKPKKLARMDNDKNALDWDKDPQIEWFTHEDVVRSWIMDYNVDETRRRHVCTGARSDEYDNAKQAADNYLDKHLERIILEGGYTRSYRRLHVIRNDGAIREVTVSFQAGDGGNMTMTASFNKEHDRWLPAEKTRRFKEALEVNVQAAAQNREFARPVQDNAFGIRDNAGDARKGA